MSRAVAIITGDLDMKVLGHFVNLTFRKPPQRIPNFEDQHGSPCQATILAETLQ
jgi:hypothetical protein